MALPDTPDPCPDLREGLALGAPEHTGFVAAWNWVVGIFRKASDYLCLGVNDITGEVNIVAGNGIKVESSGRDITISLYTPDPDDPNPPDPDPDEPNPDDPTTDPDTNPGPTGGPPPNVTSPDTGSGEGGCNGWADDDINNADDDAGNDGDSCAVLNGW